MDIYFWSAAVTIIAGIASIISLFFAFRDRKQSLNKSEQQGKNIIFVPEHIKKQQLDKSRRKQLFTLAIISIIVFIVSGTILYVSKQGITLSSLKATATVSAVASTVNTATPTLHKTSSIPYPPYKGTLAINDPLTASDNQNSNWDQVMDPDLGFCQFIAGAYHAEILQFEHFYRCSIEASNFGNFVYQIKMTLIKGDRAGIVFRADDASESFYEFRISADGSYAFNIFQNHSLVTEIIGGTSPIIKSIGIHTNGITIAIVAQNSNFYFYANQQLINHASDSTFTAGQIGVIADKYKNPTEAAFNNATIWTI